MLRMLGILTVIAFVLKTGSAQGHLPNLACHVCSYYPGVRVNWSGDIDCQDTIQDDKFVKNCSEVIANTKDAIRYRCRKTVGKGVGDKPFYIRSCSISTKEFDEHTIVFDLAITSYCIPNKCNGSEGVLQDNISFIVLVTILTSKLVSGTFA